MAEVLRFINTASTAGGDGTTNATTGPNRAYASLNEGEAAEQTDLVTAGDTMRFVCEGTAADTTDVRFDGWITGASNFITVETDPDAAAGRHNGIYSTSHYRIEVTNFVAFEFRENYVRVDGIQVQATGTSGSSRNSFHIITLDAGAADTRISNCVIKGVMSGTVSSGTGIQVGASSSHVYKIFNNIILDFDFGADISFRGIAAGPGRAIIYNNTVMDCGRNFQTVSNIDVGFIKNNIANGGTVVDWNGAWGNHTTANNISEDATSPDASFRNLAVTFVNEGGDDFHLAASDTAALNQGADLSADAEQAITDDIDGDTRPQGLSFDIGADERLRRVLVT